MKKDKTKDKEVAPTTPNVSLRVNIIAIKLITTMCPAEMLANKRTNKEKGLITKAPANSIIAKTGLSK